jgi:hypothetical protein
MVCVQHAPPNVGVCTQPLDELHESVVHGSSSSQLIGVEAHAPVVGSQKPAWHGSGSVQFNASLAHV